MQTVLIVIHLLIVLALIVTVLLQRSEGGLGLGGGGSSGGGGVGGFMTGRGQANALTRATAILAALFFTTSMTLAVMAHRSAAPRSILDDGQTSQQAPQAPASADTLLDTLRGGGAANAPAPAAPAPAAPAAPSPGAPEAPQSR